MLKFLMWVMRECAIGCARRMRWVVLLKLRIHLSCLAGQGDARKAGTAWLEDDFLHVHQCV